jgi:hypothetical protein
MVVPGSGSGSGGGGGGGGTSGHFDAGGSSNSVVERGARGVVAQVEFESKIYNRSSYFSVKRLVPGAFNLCLIG